MGEERAAPTAASGWAAKLSEEGVAMGALTLAGAEDVVVCGRTEGGLIVTSFARDGARRWTVPIDRPRAECGPIAALEDGSIVVAVLGPWELAAISGDPPALRVQGREVGTGNPSTAIEISASNALVRIGADGVVHWVVPFAAATLSRLAATREAIVGYGLDLTRLLIWDLEGHEREPRALPADTVLRGALVSGDGRVVARVDRVREDPHPVVPGLQYTVVLSSSAVVLPVDAAQAAPIAPLGVRDEDTTTLTVAVIAAPARSALVAIQRDEEVTIQRLLDGEVQEIARLPAASHSYFSASANGRHLVRARLRDGGLGDTIEQYRLELDAAGTRQRLELVREIPITGDVYLDPAIVADDGALVYAAATEGAATIGAVGIDSAQRGSLVVLPPPR